MANALQCTCCRKVFEPLQLEIKFLHAGAALGVCCARRLLLHRLNAAQVHISCRTYRVLPFSELIHLGRAPLARPTISYASAHVVSGAYCMDGCSASMACSKHVCSFGMRSTMQCVEGQSGGGGALAHMPPRTRSCPDCSAVGTQKAHVVECTVRGCSVTLGTVFFVISARC